jgi:uncharacterized membrane protein YphA (DoxX/SURF4 family)
MDTFVWIGQILLCFAFGYSGIMKSSQSREYLVRIGQTGVEGLSYPLIRFIGISEILGAIGVIVPWLTNILPILTPVSALGFAAIMMLAAPIHYRRKEFASVGANVFLLAVSTFVAYMRFTEVS